MANVKLHGKVSYNGSYQCQPMVDGQRGSPNFTTKMCNCYNGKTDVLRIWTNGKVESTFKIEIDDKETKVARRQFEGHKWRRRVGTISVPVNQQQYF